MSPIVVLGSALICTLFVGAVRADEPAPTVEQVRNAVTKALPLLRQGAEGHMAERKCFACHHQTLPLLALKTAGSRGFAVDDKYVEQNMAFIERFLESGRERYREGRGQGGNTIMAGYALWTLAIGNHPSSDTTTMVSDYLIAAQKENAHWRVTTIRPPSEGSHFAATYVAIRGLQAYGTAAQKEAIAKRFDEVRTWLVATKPQDTEDRVFRLWSLARLDAEAKSIESARDDLRDTQQADGGWSQLADRDSDAYATGTALVALHEAGGMATDDPVYQRGLAFLLKSQQDDGSWLVKSRSKPIQTYFETGFPHEKDQFLSSAATGWAATALVLSLPIEDKPRSDAVP